MKSTFRLVGFAVAVVLLAAGCASYDGEIPIDSALTEITYISPANQDGIQDVLELSVDIPRIEGLTIWSYRFTVTDSRGKVVYEAGEAKSPDVKGKAARTSLEIPKSISWNGKASDGTWVPDGEYSYRISAAGSKGQEGSTPSLPVVVDNTPPYLVLSVPYLTFSPNGDGRQDALPIYQTESSSEVLWEGHLLSSTGKTLATITWAGLAANFTWDGMDREGKPVPDGIYGYRIGSTDLAGNSFSLDLDDFTIDTSPSIISATTSQRYISPNKDGVLDDLSLTVASVKTTGITDWRLSIISSTGTELRTWTGASLPQTIRFDGNTDRGTRISDGEYFGQLIVNYANGDQPRTYSEKFISDTAPPSAVSSMSYQIFSPDGDGRRDTVAINRSSSLEAAWTSRILNASGSPVRSFEKVERLTPIVWDGRDNNGFPVADGSYFLETSSTDLGGNTFNSRTSAIVVDTRPTPVQLSVDSRGLSPNGDGTSDTLRFVPAPVVRDGISGWVFRISNTEDGSGWSMNGTSRDPVPLEIIWDGRDGDKPVKDGQYDVNLVVEYEKGNRSEAVLESTIIVDTEAPVLSVGLSPLPFSPDADGFNDLLTITPKVIDSNGISSWRINIKDPKGTPFYEIGRRGTPAAFTWNGLSTNGELVRSAEDYALSLEATDEFGNTGTVNSLIPIDILVIKEGNRYRISISSIYFKPFTADYRNIEPELARKNLETLDRLAVVLKKYGTYNIDLEGHAVRLLWADSNKWRTEESDILLPLSTERAEVIKDALVSRGIAASRMSTRGYGGTRPLVPHSDEINRWKNRRVEFLLVR